MKKSRENQFNTDISQSKKEMGTGQVTEYKFEDKLKCDEMEILEDKELSELADSRSGQKAIKVSIDEL